MQIRRARAVCAALTAVVLAACTLLAEWHQATVIHARCAEHGELVHVSAGASRGAGEDRVAARDAAGERRGAQHDHCTLCPRNHDGAPPQLTFVPAAMPPVTAVVAVAPRAPAIIGYDALTDAPKTSPPASSISVS